MYDDITCWFVFRSKDGRVKGIAEIEGLIPALTADDVIANYKNKGLFLTKLIASPNDRFKGKIRDQMGKYIDKEKTL